MRRSGLATLLLVALAGCRSAAPLPPPPTPDNPARPQQPLEPDAEPPEAELRVRPAAGPLVVAAWAEPSHLPAGGGQAQILVRVQTAGGKAYSGVEVKLHASRGTLFSAGRVLTTDARGMTRDRLSTRRSALVTLNAGGTRYSFVVPVLPREALPTSQSE